MERRGPAHLRVQVLQVHLLGSFQGIGPQREQRDGGRADGQKQQDRSKDLSKGATFSANDTNEPRTGILGYMTGGDNEQGSALVL